MRGKTAEDLRLLELLDPVAEVTGYEIVRLRLMGGEFQRRLQIMAERPDGDMNVEDCAKLSRAFSEIMDAADPIKGEYVLEVSSPGVDRPLTKPEHFRRFLGRKVRVRTREAIEGQRNFKGTLAGADDESVTVAGDGALVRIPFDGVERSNLIPELDFGGES